jgi:hypothetical protein
MTTNQRAYHFVSNTLRDGRPVPADGVWLDHEGPIQMCESGLHASIHPFDALCYAPGPILCSVDLDGDTVIGTDKVVARRRRIRARIDATALLGQFARTCALDVLHLWDAPAVVRDYLTTGDETIREDARRAACDAAAANAAASAFHAAARFRGAASVAAAYAAPIYASYAAAELNLTGTHAAAAANAYTATAAAAAAHAATRARQREQFATLVTAAFREIGVDVNSEDTP